MNGSDRNRPYNALPLLPPTAELETVAILKQAITANRVLAELKGLAQRIPIQGILINDLVLQEARLSSEIENILTTTARQTVAVYLQTLERLGLLKSQKSTGASGIRRFLQG